MASQAKLGDRQLKVAGLIPPFERCQRRDIRSYTVALTLLQAQPHTEHAREVFLSDVLHTGVLLNSVSWKTGVDPSSSGGAAADSQALGVRRESTLEAAVPGFRLTRSQAPVPHQRGQADSTPEPREPRQ